MSENYFRPPSTIYAYTEASMCVRRFKLNVLDFSFNFYHTDFETWLLKHHNKIHAYIFQMDITMPQTSSNLHDTILFGIANVVVVR